MDADTYEPAAPSRWAVLTTTARRPGLRSVVLVFACFKAAELGAWIAITTVAYVTGGVNLATVVLVVQLAPATVAALLVERAIGAAGPARVLVGGLVLQAAGLAGVAAVLWTDGPFPLAVVGAVVAATAVVTTRPALQTLLPRLVEGPAELTAANSVMGWILGAATLLGPVVTAATITSVGTWAPFVVFALTNLLAAGLAARLGRRVPPGTDGATTDLDEGTGPVEANDGTTDLGAVRLTLLVVGAGGFLWGAIDLLAAVVAIDLTGGPAARAAVMAAAFGAGALAGGLATVVLIGRRHLWPAMALSALLTAVAMAAVGLTSQPVVAGLLLAAVGATSTAMVVAARSLLQRISDFTTVCRAFALAEATEMGTLLAGAVVVPLLVVAVGARWTPTVVGVAVALAAVLASRRVATAEAGVADQFDRLDVLRRTPLLATLPAPTLELLARQSDLLALADGTTVIAEGDVGDRFYVVQSGQVAVRRGTAELRRMGPGSGFGEIALLLDRPRTATVTTVGRTTLVVVERHVFLTAVTGHTPSHRRVAQLAVQHADDDYSD